MNELALFAGAGGGILGGILLGWRTICAVEIDPYAASVLVQRQNDGILPPFPIWDDVRTFDGRPWRGIVDVLSGGYPCQAWSTAAAGKNNARNMWPEMFRIIGEVEPRFVLCENVDEGAIVQSQKDLAECGYATMRGMVAAGDVGADHPRERWWLVADSNHESKLVRSIDAKMAVIKKGGKSLWETIPDIARVDDGMAARMDRLKAIGNGQVPAVVELAWKTLTIAHWRKED
jgi:DNA (cytosine-5)-methyltransferase 1